MDLRHLRLITQIGIGLAAVVIVCCTLLSGWPFQLKVISNMNETGVRKTGNNTLGNIDSKQPQIENSLFDKGLQKSDRGALSREYLTEEELRYEMPLTDIKLTVDVAASSLRLIEKRESYRTGDKIEVLVILYDGNKKQRDKGGDDLRVRTFNKEKNAYAAGQVKDHNNGTYTASIQAYWPGKHVIEVMLVNTRESIRALFYIRQKVPSTRIKKAIFRKKETEFLSDCHPDKHWLKGGSEACDFTSKNSGMSWFCTRFPGFRCEDVTSMKTGYVLDKDLPMTDAEKELFRSPWKPFPVITLNVMDSVEKKRISLPDCNSYPRELLWNKTGVMGYFYNNKWRHLHCQGPIEESYRTCLNEKNVILTGDSTTRAWFLYLMQKFDCKLKTQKWTGPKWYKRSICESTTNNLRLEWVPHAMPFFGHYAFSDIHSISNVLEDIDNTTETVVLIHMYYHLVGYHHSVFKERMQIISKGVDKLITKNKKVTVLIKGPSTCKHQDSEYVNDYFGYIYNDIIHETFRGMYDKIVFLDMQDMTIAKKTPGIHPPADEVREAVHQMLNYVCERNVNISPST